MADQPALIHAGQVISFRELRRRAGGIAGYLQGLGLPAVVDRLTQDPDGVLRRVEAAGVLAADVVQPPHGLALQGEDRGEGDPAEDHGDDDGHDPAGAEGRDQPGAHGEEVKSKMPISLELPETEDFTFAADVELISDERGVRIAREEAD